MSDGHYSYRHKRQRLEAEAEALGVPVKGSTNALSAAVYHAKQEPIDRARPCRECGAEGEREDRFKCDECVAKYQRDLDLFVDQCERQRQARQEVKQARAKLSPAQRWLTENDDLTTARELRLAALGEVD